MIAYLAAFLSSLFEGRGRAKNARLRGYEDMTEKLNVLRCGHEDDYDPSLVFSSRAKLIGEFQGTSEELRRYQEGMRDAITAYEREYGAP